MFVRGETFQPSPVLTVFLPLCLAESRAAFDALGSPAASRKSQLVELKQQLRDLKQCGSFPSWKLFGRSVSHDTTKQLQHNIV